MQQHQICRPIVWQLLQQSYCPSHSGGHGDGRGDGHEDGNGDSHGVFTGQGGGSNGGKEKVLAVSNVQTYCLLGSCFSRAPLSKPFINHCLLLGQNIWLVAIAEKKITPQRIHSSARPMQIKPKKMQKFHFKAKLHFYMLAGFEVVACFKLSLQMYKYVSRIQLPIQKYYQRYVFYAKPTKYVWRLPWS